MTILGAESQRSYGHREPVDGGEEALFTAGHSEQSEEKTEWQGLEEREGKPGARGRGAVYELGAPGSRQQGAGLELGN
mgnify:CR=1 FL=1